MVPPEHYFSATPGGEIVYRTISVDLAGRRFELTTANGIFSPERVDVGTNGIAIRFRTEGLASIVRDISGRGPLLEAAA